MKKVVLIANYFHFKEEKKSNRYRTLAEMLSENSGIELEVITSLFYQRTKSFRKNTEELAKNLNYKVAFIKEPGYSKNVSIKRLISSRVFARNVIKYLKKTEKPDLIYQVVPTVDVAYKVAKYARKNHIPFIIDVQDLWPEAFKMAINIPVISRLCFWPIKRKVNYVYANADDICAVSETYLNRALSVNDKGIKGHSVYIGVDLDKFDEYSAQAEPRTDFKPVLAYCGALGKSYDIETVIKALSLVKNPPKFLVMGEGGKKPELIKMAKDLGVDAEFTGFISYPEMCKRLKNCDMVVNPIIGTSCASIINKHGDYAATGLPVLNTQNSAEYIELVREYDMGLNSPSSDEKALAKNIEFLMDNAEERMSMGKNARRCAEERFDRKNTYLELIKAISEKIEADKE